MSYKRTEYDYDADNYWELEFFRIKAYYEENNTAEKIEELEEQLRRMTKNYEDACVQLGDRNSSEFYTKLVEGWKEEKLQLQKRIDELEEGLRR